MQQESGGGLEKHWVTEACGFVGCLKASVQDRVEYFESESQFEEVNKPLIST